MIEAVERIRAHHERTLGHRPTNRVGYCAESDGISATYCETGILLAALPDDGRDCTEARRELLVTLRERMSKTLAAPEGTVLAAVQDAFMAALIKESRD